MFKNYLITAYRNLLRMKTFLLVTSAGLAVGMAAFLLILHYVQFERGYDNYHPYADRIYRLRYERITEDGQAVRFSSCCPPAGGIIRDRYPEVERLARMFRYRAVVSHEDIKFVEERMIFAEPDFLEIFSYDIVEGDPAHGLSEPGRAFVSESTARKYFGDEDPIGKTLTVDSEMDFLVVGLYRDVPANTHLKCDILLSFEDFVNLFGPDYMESWGHTLMYTYLRLQEDGDPLALEQKLADLVEEQFGEVLRQYHMTMLLPLQPVTNIHLDSHFMQELETNGNRNVVNILFIIAFFIIVVAWVNYINLSTARSLTRAREVGLRKVVGASRIQLIIQFFTETAILHALAVVMAIILVETAMPLFRSVTGMPSGMSIWAQPWFIPAIILLFVLGILFSGIYPVLAMTGFRPVSILRGKIGAATKGLNLRKALVVFQFITALALITGTLVARSQISYMLNQDIGFKSDQIMVVRSPRVRQDAFAEQLKTFKQTLLNNPAVEKLCHVSEVPGRQILWDNGGIRRLGEDVNKGKNYQIVGVDYDFVDVFGLDFVTGRNFSRDFSTDPTALLLNETSVRVMGFENAESSIGQQIDYWGQVYTIIGVLKNYHQQSLKEAFEPHLYRFMPTGWGNRGQFAIQVGTENLGETIDLIKSRYEEFFPGNPFEYFFLDDFFDQQYQSDRLFGCIIGWFTVLSVFITALGLFGLASFSAAQRTKEIGIRKVLGASTPGILTLLTTDYLRLIALGFVLSLPVLIIGSNRFLQQYAFRTSVKPWLFLLPLIGITLVTLFTVSSQVLKAASGNPVDAIKYE